MNDLEKHINRKQTCNYGIRKAQTICYSVFVTRFNRYLEMVNYLLSKDQN